MSEQFNVNEYMGESVAIRGTRFRSSITCKKGTPDEYKAQAWEAEVTVLSGEDAGKRYDDALIFSTALVSKLGKADGDPVIGKLFRTESLEGRPYVTIDDPSYADFQLAAKHGV